MIQDSRRKKKEERVSKEDTRLKIKDLALANLTDP